MSKQEKYINYIVDDLVKKTEIDNEQQKITLPFISLPPISFTHSYFFSYSLPISPHFSKYIKNLYGTKDNEVQIIWDLYREKIQSLIKKYE